MRATLFVLTVSALLFGCNQQREATPSKTVTQTIAPADAQPAPPSATDTTQTVELGDGRSEAEGGTVEVATNTATKGTAGKLAPVRKKAHK